jgi:hypothetical protein
VNFLVILAVDERSWVWRNLFLSGTTFVVESLGLACQQKEESNHWAVGCELLSGESLR